MSLEKVEYPADFAIYQRHHAVINPAHQVDLRCGERDQGVVVALVKLLSEGFARCSQPVQLDSRRRQVVIEREVRLGRLVGRMRIEIRKPEKEGPAGISVAVHKPERGFGLGVLRRHRGRHRFFRQARILAPPVSRPRQILVPFWMRFQRWILVPVVEVGSGQEGVVLAAQAGDITGVAQHIWDIGWRPRARMVIGVTAVCTRPLTAVQAPAIGQTDRRGRRRVGKGHTLLRQPVEIGRSYPTVAQGVNSIEALLISVDEQDVGFHASIAHPILLDAMLGAPFVQGIVAAARLKLRRIIDFFADKIFLNVGELLQK